MVRPQGASRLGPSFAFWPQCGVGPRWPIVLHVLQTLMGQHLMMVWTLASVALVESCCIYCAGGKSSARVKASTAGGLSEHSGFEWAASGSLVLHCGGGLAVTLPAMK